MTTAIFKNVPSLEIRFDEAGMEIKGDYVVKIEDVDKLTEYLSKTTNYYDKALSEVVMKSIQTEKMEIIVVKQDI